MSIANVDGTALVSWLAAPSPGAALLALLLGGTYPAITWTAYLLVGALAVPLGALLRGRIRTALEPVRAAGAAPLTISVLHIVALTLASRALDAEIGPEWLAQGPAALAIHVGAVLAVGLVLALLGRKGPLEALLARTIRLAVPRRSRDAEPTSSARRTPVAAPTERMLP